MKTKTFILIAWPVSVLLVGWIGFVLGTSFGVDVGTAAFHNERVRRFQLDVAEVAKLVDPRTREVLVATANLAGRMVDADAYAEANQEFGKKIRDLPKLKKP
jgi:hypothetical protein